METDERKEGTGLPEGHYINIGIALGIPLGIPVGLALGILSGNIAVGLSVGPAIGAAIGMLIGSYMEKTKNPKPIPLTREERKRRNLIVAGLVVILVVGMLTVLYISSESRGGNTCDICADDSLSAGGVSFVSDSVQPKAANRVQDH